MVTEKAPRMYYNSWIQIPKNIRRINPDELYIQCPKCRSEFVYSRQRLVFDRVPVGECPECHYRFNALTGESLWHVEDWHE